MTPDLYLLPIDPRRTNPFNRAEEGHRLIAAETQTSTSCKHDIISFSEFSFDSVLQNRGHRHRMILNPN